MKKLVVNVFRLVSNRVVRITRKSIKGQHQQTSTTEINRYPELFDEVLKYSKGFPTEMLNILSYGCSTGEECITLKSYFSESSIIGVDINRRNLAIARAKYETSKIKFLFSSSENILRCGKFHLIFCLSVLCRWEDTMNVSNCGDIYPFDKFQDAIVDLFNALHVGGFLVVYNSNFKIEDTVVANKFVPMPTPSISSSGFVHKFDANNERVFGPHINCIYKKISE